MKLFSKQKNKNIGSEIIFENLKDNMKTSLQEVESTQNSPSVTHEHIADHIRRWGYLNADIDSLGRIEKNVHPSIAPIDKELYKKYFDAYCGKIGTEFMHIFNQEKVDWLKNELENQKNLCISKDKIFDSLLNAEAFESFIHKRYVGAKRFSIEGLATMVPAIDTILTKAAEEGFEMAIIGMSHRGRLTSLHLGCGVDAHKIFACFEEVDPKASLGSGDVKYHRGATGEYVTESGKKINVRMASNPSHLEAVNPVVIGRVKGEQELKNDIDQKKVLAIIIHGDAAFAGQGITAETLNYEQIDGFSIGGSINIIANNLIGFTATPEQIHTSKFCTSIAKRLEAPIFHVNSDDATEVCRAAQIATEYKINFNSEVFIDIIGYRKFGHNEVDDPNLTSPVVYKKIKELPDCYKKFAEKANIDASEVATKEEARKKYLEEEYQKAKDVTSKPQFFSQSSLWEGYEGGKYSESFEVPTNVSPQVIEKIGENLSSVPEGFQLYPKLKRLLEDRKKMSQGQKPIDWGTAEAFAFGSLLHEGTGVRLTGQDSCRGTFTQRIAVLTDIENGAKHTPLEGLCTNGASFTVKNSILSEAAAVGYEYGYSRQRPDVLTLWEAQFGDFANGAQIIIDQFISAGEDKWELLSGLVMLLPHGYEGQGPEHSSGRIERFLQLAGEDNIQVANLSKSSQYFHLLRRQQLRKWRKPLILFTPKSMLRLPAAASKLEDLTEGKFHEVLGDTINVTNPRKLILCSGKIVHELRAARDKAGKDDVAICTIEQLYPFPEKSLKNLRDSYGQIEKVVWVQEEPANMGALFFVQDKIKRIFNSSVYSSVKRSESASPATGSYKAHDMEQKTIIEFALS